MSVKTSAILGMGAVGSAVASYLFSRYSNDFYVIATGDRAKRLAKQGMIVNNINIMPQIMEKRDAFSERLDLVIVTVKNYDLQSAIDDLSMVIDKHTVILPLLNGVTAVDRLKAAFPKNKVLFGIILRTDAERIGHRVTFSTTGEIQLGDDIGSDSSQAQAIGQFLSNAGLYANIYLEMERMLWRKWMINIGCNQVSVVAEAEFRYFRVVPEIVELMRVLMNEIVSIAAAENVYITEKDRDEVIEIILDYPPHKKTSMLQDIQAMRRTEIDYFAGTVVEYGKKHRIATPMNYALYLAIKARENVYLYKKEHGFGDGDV